ncbi:LytTR family DNA-binding domain-containing protein [Marinicrinis lubricantis]|uniref:LytTR family DNA-binding domain-containing protein n=1 Tax=Marinicrinis lubricantis TaxID=2086470 RepID=A0ABW1IPZ6_9BACL
MMHIPVLKELEDGTTQLFMLDLEDVIYIRLEKRNILYHTLDDRYWHISTLSDWEEHLGPYGFELTDKTNLVNFKRIKTMDPSQGKLYFDEHPDEHSKFATIAFIKQKMYEHEIARRIALNTDKSLEMKLDRAGNPSRSDPHKDYN